MIGNYKSTYNSFRGLKIWTVDWGPNLVEEHLPDVCNVIDQYIVLTR